MNSIIPMQSDLQVYRHITLNTTGSTETVTFTGGSYMIMVWVLSARAIADMALYLLESSTANHRVKIAKVLEDSSYVPVSMTQSEADVTFTSTATYACVDIIKLR